MAAFYQPCCLASHGTLWLGPRVAQRDTAVPVELTYIMEAIGVAEKQEIGWIKPHTF